MGGSALFKSLRSRFRGKSSFGSDPSGQKDSNGTPQQTAWATPETSGMQRNYYDMSDTNLVKSQVTSHQNGRGPVESSHDGIVRSVDISQDVSRHYWALENDSRECLA